MRCPECQTPNPDGVPSCPHCGLLVSRLAPLRRRREDAADGLKRRSSDQTRECPLCRAALDEGVVRCRHCSAIVDEDYRRALLLKRRRRLNYSAWATYLLGVVAIFVYPPAGILAVTAAILMSIVYYALPVDEPKETSGAIHVLQTTVRRVASVERVELRLPMLPRMRLILVGTPLAAALAGFLLNFFLLQRPMNEVIRENPSLRGMDISAHYQYWIIPGAVVYNLRGISEQQSRLDVHKGLVEFARKMSNRRVREVELQFRGKTRFAIAGPEFHRLASEYQRGNYAWVLFEFPRMVHKDADAARSGRDALLEFHDRWYGEILTRPISGRVPAAVRPAPAP